MMSASVTASSIGPAIFGNTSILCIGLLLFAENLKRRDLYIISTLMVISIGMDVAYLVISVILLIVAGFILLFRKKEQITGVVRTSILRIAITGTLVIAGWLLVPALQFGLNGKFEIAQNSNTNIFFQKDAQSLFNTSVYQALNIKIGRYNMQRKGSKGYNAIYRWYKNEVRACYIISCQMNGWLDLTPLNYCQMISAILCVCAFIPILMKRISSRHRNLFTYIILAFFIYAIVNAVLYGQRNGLQSHVVWLLPVPVFLYLSEAAVVNRWKFTIEKYLTPDNASEPI